MAMNMNPGMNMSGGDGSSSNRPIHPAMSPQGRVNPHRQNNNNTTSASGAGSSCSTKSPPTGNGAMTAATSSWQGNAANRSPPGVTNASSLTNNSGSMSSISCSEHSNYSAAVTEDGDGDNGSNHSNHIGNVGNTSNIKVEIADTNVRGVANANVNMGGAGMDNAAEAMLVGEFARSSVRSLSSIRNNGDKDSQ